MLKVIKVECIMIAAIVLKLVSNGIVLNILKYYYNIHYVIVFILY